MMGFQMMEEEEEMKDMNSRIGRSPLLRFLLSFQAHGERVTMEWLEGKCATGKGTRYHFDYCLRG